MWPPASLAIGATHTCDEVEQGRRHPHAAGERIDRELLADDAAFEEQNRGWKLSKPGALSTTRRGPPSCHARGRCATEGSIRTGLAPGSVVTRAEERPSVCDQRLSELTCAQNEQKPMRIGPKWGVQRT